MPTTPHLTPSFRKPRKNIPLVQVKVFQLFHQMAFELSKVPSVAHTNLKVSSVVTQLVNDFLNSPSGEEVERVASKDIGCKVTDWKSIALEQSVYQRLQAWVKQQRKERGLSRKEISSTAVICHLIRTKHENVYIPDVPAIDTRLAIQCHNEIDTCTVYGYLSSCFPHLKSPQFKQDRENCQVLVEVVDRIDLTPEFCNTVNDLHQHGVYCWVKGKG